LRSFFKFELVEIVPARASKVKLGLEKENNYSGDAPNKISLLFLFQTYLHVFGRFFFNLFKISTKSNLFLSFIFILFANTIFSRIPFSTNWIPLFNTFFKFVLEVSKEFKKSSIIEKSKLVFKLDDFINSEPELITWFLIVHISSINDLNDDLPSTWPLILNQQLLLLLIINIFGKIASKLGTSEDEFLLLKKKYNVKRKTKLLKNIDQNEELETINNQILEEFINKKTKLQIDNRMYLRKIIFNNYKKSFEGINKIIDNKNIQKFICNVDKNLKLIGITYTGKVFHLDWESNIDNDHKLDNKSLGNIDPNEIINFHSIKKGIKTYLCILNSDGRFKKVLFDEDMTNSNRSFAITKLKNNIKTIDSFIYKEKKNLAILTSIGRIFKFNLSNKLGCKVSITAWSYDCMGY